jgi:ketosteroid isomerase-like protein
VLSDEDEVRALVDATIAGFNAGDADAYLAMAHDRAVQRMSGLNAFVRTADVRGLAPQVLSMTERFTVSYEGTEVIGDTAVLWGTFENVLRGGGDADGAVSHGQFTLTCVRTDDGWKAVCSHYSAV